jgi:hypothetical protein
VRLKREESGAPKGSLYSRLSLGLARLLLRARLAPGGAAQAEGLSFVTDRRHDTRPTRALAAELGLPWPVAALIEAFRARIATGRAPPAVAATRRTPAAAA